MAYPTTRATIARKPLKGVKINVEQVEELIKKHRGVVCYVAEEIGCSRYTIHDMINTHPQLKIALDDARERLIDLVEDTYIDKAIKGDSMNATFILKTRGRHRGYDIDMRETNDVLKQALGFILNRTHSPVQGQSKQQQDVNIFPSMIDSDSE